MMERILIVEDNKVANITISRLLESNGYQIFSVYNAEDALTEVSRKRYDMIILDIHLPKMSGYTFLQILRKKSDIPVIINTANSTVKARVKLINAGASDFIEKSYTKEEILESIRIILDDRKKKQVNKNIFTYKDIEIDFTSRQIRKDGELIELTSKEFDVLKVLFDNPERAFSRQQLYLIVWGEEYSEQVDNTINVHVKRLRNKIEDNPKKPAIIETVYAFGYRLGKEIVSKLKN